MVTPEDHAPWFVQALIGFGAWLSCSLFLGSLTIAGLFDEGMASVAVGVCLLAAGAAVDRFTNGSFTRQLGLAAGLTGLVLTGIGIIETTHANEASGITIAIALATTVFYVPYGSEPFRFLSCLTTVTVATVWALDKPSTMGGDEMSIAWGLFSLILVETLGVGLIFMRFQKRILQPAGYAMAVGLLGTLLATQFPHTPQAWPSVILLAMALVWTIRKAWTADSSRWKEGLAVTGTGLLAALSVPGIIAAVGTILLGHLERNSVLKRLGILFLPVFIASYYYNLDTSLLLKSLALIGSGPDPVGRPLVLQAAHSKSRTHDDGGTTMKSKTLIVTSLFVLGCLNWMIIAKERLIYSGRTVLCELAPARSAIDHAG